MPSWKRRKTDDENCTDYKNFKRNKNKMEEFNIFDIPEILWETKLDYIQWEPATADALIGFTPVYRAETGDKGILLYGYYTVISLPEAFLIEIRPPVDDEEAGLHMARAKVPGAGDLAE